MSTTPPLELRTGDLDQFREAIAGLLGPISLTARVARYDARLRHRSIGALTFTRIAYDHPIDIEVAPLSSHTIVQLPLSGSFHSRTTGGLHHISSEHAQVVAPPMPISMRSTSATEFLVIAAAASEVAGEEALPETLPLTGAGMTLANAIRFLLAEAERDGSLLGAGRGARQAQQMLFALLVDAAVHRGPSTGGRAWYVKRAESFMEANLGADIGVADVAASASVHMRTLHHGFRSAHGVSPMSWLKQRRLDRVRAELLAADPGATNVTEVALRWGLVHLSRFAADYRARFGELPSQTLRRRR